MSLDEVVERVKSGARKVADYFSVPNQTESMRDYAIRQYLTDDQRRIFDEASPEERSQLESRLETHIQESVDSQRRYIDGFSARLGRATGWGALANSALHTYLNTPWTKFGYLQVALTLGKGALELPSMVGHTVSTRNYAGFAEWLGLKAVSIAVPVLGPAADIDAAPRIIKKRAIRDGTNAFLKEVGAYEPKPGLFERLYSHVKQKAQPVFDTPMAYA